MRNAWGDSPDPTSLHLTELQGSASNEAEALEEAQEALEKVVLPTMKPIELLPRTVDVVRKQTELVEHSYGLATQIVGKGMQVRLRILPSIALSSAMAGPTTRDPGALQ